MLIDNDCSRANECRNYWASAGELRDALRVGGDQRTVDLCLDEIEAIQMHTQQPTLHRLCTNILAQHRPAYRIRG